MKCWHSTHGYKRIHSIRNSTNISVHFKISTWVFLNVYYLQMWISSPPISNLDSYIFWNDIQVTNTHIVLHVHFYMTFTGRSLSTISDRDLSALWSKAVFPELNQSFKLGKQKKCELRKTIHSAAEAAPWCLAFPVVLQCCLWRSGYQWQNRIK